MKNFRATFSMPLSLRTSLCIYAPHRGFKTPNTSSTLPSSTTRTQHISLGVAREFPIQHRNNRCSQAPLLVLLDRDGVINVDRGTWVQDEKDFVLVEGAAEAIASLNRAGHVVAVVTNQSCVGRGLLSAADLDKIHSTMISHLAKSGAHLDQIYVATNTPEDSSSTRRKPAPGMLLEAMAEFGFDMDSVVMIGDSLTDMKAALAAGVRRKILVTTGHGLKLVGEELDVWSLKPPCFVLPALGDFGGLPSEVLPVSIHADLKSAAEELLADSLAGTTVQEVDEET